METEEAIEIFRDHLNMKDGTEFIWKDWEEAALHILTLATESEQLRKERDELAAFIRQKHDVLEVPTEIFNLCIQNR